MLVPALSAEPSGAFPVLRTAAVVGVQACGVPPGPSSAACTLLSPPFRCLQGALLAACAHVLFYAWNALHCLVHA